MKTRFRAAVAVPPRIASRAFYGASGLLRLAGAGLNWIRIRHLDFDPRPDDVFLVAYPHSGMAWLQLIVHRITWGGELDFTHIGDRIPWFERLAFRDVRVRELASPRVFKSHLRYPRVPRGGVRRVYLCRDPRDVLREAFDFQRAHGSGHEISFPEFFERFEQGRLRYGRWADHVGEWWSHRDDPDLLVLWYEELRADLEGAIRKISGFLGAEIEEEEIPPLVERCRGEVLARHGPKFDEVVELLAEMGLTAGGSFIRSGRSGEGAQWLSDDQRRRLDARVRERTGHDVATLMRSSSRVGGT